MCRIGCLCQSLKFQSTNIIRIEGKSLSLYSLKTKNCLRVTACNSLPQFKTNKNKNNLVFVSADFPRFWNELQNVLKPVLYIQKIVDHHRKKVLHEVEFCSKSVPKCQGSLNENSEISAKEQWMYSERKRVQWKGR